MASKTGGLSLGAVNERRLRPIYEHLDNGNNKSALHEAEKVLKKQKDLLAAKVLKTIALQRLGKEDEAFSLSEEVAGLGPTDENSLQGLSLFYRETRRADLIPRIYESAVTKCPGNEEYLTHLFMSYVRTERLKDMQRVAILLYKHHPKNPYLFWGIMAIVMQAQNDDKLGKAMFLPLAERMIEKHIKKGKIEAEAEIRLYLTILKLLGKHEKSLQVLEGNPAMHFSLHEDGLSDLKLGIFRQMGKWERVNQENKMMLKQDPAVWNYIVGYFDSLQHLVESGWKPEESDSAGTSLEEPDHTWQQGVDLILNLVDAERNKEGRRKRRGPFLARLELYKRLKDENQVTEASALLEKLGSLVEMCLEYMRLFSDKPCCFGDLQMYFKYTSEDERKKLLQKLVEEEISFLKNEADEAIEKSDNKSEEMKLQKHLFLVKMKRCLGQHDTLDREEKLALVSDLLRRHENGLEYSSYRPVTDVRAVDDYCLLAANLMLDLYSEEGNPEDVWRAIYILELAKQRSQTNFKFKFMLIRLYCLIGVFMPCAQIYDSLDIKHMQQDTLGYIVCHSVSALGHYQLASQAFEASRAYFVSNDKDSLEFLIACFRNGTFHKVSEFANFRQQVKNSLHSALTISEHTYMDLITQADIEVPFHELMESCCMPERVTDFEKLTDNRDFRMKFDWTSDSRLLTSSQIKTSFKLEKKWLRFRELQVRALIALLNRTKEHKGDGTNNVDIAALLDQLEEAAEDSVNDPDLKLKLPLHGPPVSRIVPSMEVKYQRTTVALLRLFQELLIEIISSDGNRDLKQLSSLVTSSIEDALKKCDLSTNEISVNSAPKEKPAKHNHDSCHGHCHHDSASVMSSPEENVESALKLLVPTCLQEIKRRKLERLVLASELFSISVLVVFNFRNLVSEVKAEAIKKRRRKKGKQEPLPPLIQFYQDFVNELKQLGQKVKNAVSRMHSDAEAMTDPSSRERMTNGELNEHNHGSNCTEPHSSKASHGAAPLPEQLVKLTSESILNSTNQLTDVVQGRLHNLKVIRI